MPFKEKTAKRRNDKAYYERIRAMPGGAERLRELARARYARHLAKPGVKERRRRYDKSEKAKILARKRKLRLFYGLTLEQYEWMVLEQNSRCAICGLVKDKLHVDHDHGTGAVRKLLCQPCNSAIGLLEESPARLEMAAAYLRAFGR